jgi:hypothetical protein
LIGFSAKLLVRMTSAPQTFDQRQKIDMVAGLRVLAGDGRAPIAADLGLHEEVALS